MSYPSPRGHRRSIPHEDLSYANNIHRAADPNPASRLARRVAAGIINRKASITAVQHAHVGRR